MKLQINLAVSQTNQSSYQKNEVAVYSMGEKIKLSATFVNDSSQNVSIDNPQTSRYSVLYFFESNDVEETIVELNPSSIDITGEVTAPISNTIQLLPQQGTLMNIDLNKFITDYSFQPGTYQIVVEYDGIKSTPLTYIIEYLPESKLKLINIALDENEPYWIREQAIDYLEKNEKITSIKLPSPNESPTDKAVRSQNNINNVKALLLNSSD